MATEKFTSQQSRLLSPKNTDLIVEKLTKMRGAALKLGQMLSIQDSTMIPEHVQSIMRRVQNNANYMLDRQLETVLVRELGADWASKFQSFDREPVAAASIGQVHKAILPDGQPVAVKVQYPGVLESIDSDLNNLSMLLKLGNLLPKGLYLENTLRVARKELRAECDYVREAQSMERFAEFLEQSNLRDYFKVPILYRNLSTRFIITSEFVDGVTIENTLALDQDARDTIGERLLVLCLKELFEFRFMQTDPNWSNFLYNVDNDMVF